MDNIVQTQNLTRRFGRKVSVHGLNLQVPKGSIYGFLGPNGAGKTTTIRMLLGLIKPTEGEIHLFGKKLHQHRKQLMKRVGSLVESPSYYAHLSGYQNLKILSILLHVPLKRIDEVLELVRLTEVAHHPVKEYSLGMKQRLGIASAVLHQPELLILDEPTNGLDPSGIKEIRQMVIEMPRQYGMTIFVSSHLLSEIEQMATHVGIIHQGKLLYQDNMQKLRKMGNKRLVIELDRPKEAMKQLESLGWQAHYANGVIYIPMSHKDSTQSILAALKPFAISRIFEKEKTLEEIFIEFTEKDQSL